MSDVNFKRLNELEVIEEAGESTYAVVEENGVPKRIPGKKIGGGLTSGGAPYQQLVTDGQGVAKWEDRKVYDIIDEIVCIDNTTYTFEPNDTLGGVRAVMVECDFVLDQEVYPDKCRVVFDGVDYELSPTDGMGPAYGNLSILSSSYPDSGEPFMCLFEGNMLIFEVNDQETKDHTLSVNLFLSNKVTLPIEYIPVDSIDGMVEVFITVGVTTTEEYQTILNKYNGKKTIRLIVDDSDGSRNIFIVCSGFEKVLDKYIQNGSHEIAGDVVMTIRNGYIRHCMLDRLRFGFSDGIVSSMIIGYPYMLYVMGGSSLYALKVSNGTVTATEVTL